MKKNSLLNFCVIVNATRNRLGLSRATMCMCACSWPPARRKRAGYGHGIAIAVECQKSKGSLHLHFWCYAQRLHQFKSLEEIGTMLEKALVSAADLKRFTENLCNESYPLSDDLEKEVKSLSAVGRALRKPTLTHKIHR